MNELRTEAEIDFAQNQIAARFRNKLWGVIVKKAPMQHQDQCDCQGCGQPAFARGAINVWGTAREVTLCQGHHQKCDGIYCDGLPIGPPVPKI